MRPEYLQPEFPQAEVSRRSFLKSSALAGGSLVVGFFVPAPLRRMAFAQEHPAVAGVKAPLPPANAFLRIGSDESVTVILAHSEMGQGICTTLPMMVNEELEADWSRIRVEHVNATQRNGHGHEVGQMQLIHQKHMGSARECRGLERNAHFEL